jgi:hypothetical protein
MAPPKATRGTPPRADDLTDAERVFAEEDASLLDIVDNVLNKGVVLSGDVTIGLAQIDLIYARVSLLLCAADRVLPSEGTDFFERHSKRHDLRVLRKEAEAAKPRRPAGRTRR